jgi:hypothetical protein
VRSAEAIRAILAVPPDHADEAGALAAGIARGERIAEEFAAANGWAEQAREPTFARAIVVDGAPSLEREVRLLAGAAPDAPFPTEASAATIEDGVLVAITPSAYRALRPEHFGIPDAWERLIAHEVLHRIFVAALRRDDETTGPRWFYEGLAVVGSGQRLGHEPEYASGAEALAGVHAPGRDSYARYGAAVRRFLARAPLPELARRAGKPGFEEWLRSLG